MEMCIYTRDWERYDNQRSIYIPEREREREIPKKRDRDTREFLEYTEWISNRNGQKLCLLTFDLFMVLIMKRKIQIHKKHCEW